MVKCRNITIAEIHNVNIFSVDQWPRTGKLITRQISTVMNKVKTLKSQSNTNVKTRCCTLWTIPTKYQRLTQQETITSNIATCSTSNTKRAKGRYVNNVNTRQAAETIKKKIVTSEEIITVVNKKSKIRRTKEEMTGGRNLKEVLEFKNGNLDTPNSKHYI